MVLLDLDDAEKGLFEFFWPVNYENGAGSVNVNYARFPEMTFAANLALKKLAHDADVREQMRRQFGRGKTRRFRRERQRQHQLIGAVLIDAER